MKHITAISFIAIALSGCCEMSYGPSQCAMRDAPTPQTQLPAMQVLPAEVQTSQTPIYKMDPVAQPVVPAMPVSAPPAPQVQTPVVVKAPFGMSPSVPAPENPVAEKQSNEKSVTKKQVARKKAKSIPSAQATTPDADWLHQ